jgi:large subunit ribosomal protein L28
MARVCDICGRGVLVGFSISHAHNKTKKRQKPNLRTVHFVHSGSNKMTLHVCADDLKELKRRGLRPVWKDQPENQKVAPVAQEVPADTTPKKMTPKQKKELADVKDSAVVDVVVNE